MKDFTLIALWKAPENTAHNDSSGIFFCSPRPRISETVNRPLSFFLCPFTRLQGVSFDKMHQFPADCKRETQCARPYWSKCIIKSLKQVKYFLFSTFLSIYFHSKFVLFYRSPLLSLGRVTDAQFINPLSKWPACLPRTVLVLVCYWGERIARGSQGKKKIILPLWMKCEKTRLLAPEDFRCTSKNNIWISP